ncbi:unnamed protein product [Rhodiola kirilowii]
MSSEHVLSAATCAWGQVDRHTWATLPLRKKILTQALTRTEENSVLMHPRVGGILTCIALMFRQKATLEHSSASFDSRGGYAEVLTSRQNRKDEGERLKAWAEGAWRNNRLSLAEAIGGL